MKKTENTFTRELDAALKEAGINRSELARRMDGQPALISRWGGSVYPTPKTIARIAKALNTNPERFLRTLPTDPYQIITREASSGLNDSRVKDGFSAINEPSREYFAAPVNPGLQALAEQAASEIRERFLLMCQASPSRRETLAERCRTRIDEFLADCQTQH